MVNRYKSVLRRSLHVSRYDSRIHLERLSKPTDSVSRQSVSGNLTEILTQNISVQSYCFSALSACSGVTLQGCTFVTKQAWLVALRRLDILTGLSRFSFFPLGECWDNSLK